MFNNKILDVLDHGDMIIQKTTGGAVVHFMDDNAEKIDENGQVDPWALRSFAYDFDSSSQYENLENMLVVIADRVNVDCQIRVAKDWDCLLDKVVSDALEWENDLIAILKKRGYELKKIEAAACSEK